MADPTQTPEALKRLCDVIAELLPRVTSGPWQAGHLIDDTSSCTCRYIFGNDDRMGAVGEVYAATDELHGDEYPPLDEAKANLRLITLAPQMAAAISALTAERDALKSEVVGQNIDRHYSRQEQVERAELAEARVAQLEARYESDVPRAGPALARVRELLKSRGTVTSSEICAMLPDIPAKTVHNSLGYLKRRGIAQSDGYGKYYSIARSTSQGGEG